MSAQTPYTCSQFYVESAASVVDATAVWHGTTLVPGGRFICASTYIQQYAERMYFV